MDNKVERDAQYASKLDADATREKLAEIYATALVNAVVASNAVFADVWDEYDSFLDVCDAYPKFEEILASAVVPVEEKTRIIDEISAGVGEVFVNFLKTLVRRGRFDMIRGIRVASRRIYERRVGRVKIRVTAAYPLDVNAREKLTDGFRKLLKLHNSVGGDPTLNADLDPELVVDVDPALIGGVVARVGDVVYDASIAAQLDLARKEMIDRSAHEIQSRRDSFGNPEGN